MQELREVKWSRSYPNRIENEKYFLERRSWGWRLIYAVYLKQENENIFLGTCHVFEREPKKNESIYVVKELNAKLPLMIKRIKEIEDLIRKNIV